jgi:hypothetical protein
MCCYRQSQIFLSVACGVVICCVADLRLFLIGSLFKVVAFLLLAYLLAFVVLDSANIWRLLIVSLSALATDFFPWFVARRWTARSQTTIAVPNEPSLSPLFQRPPPLFSL